jgi:ParB family chromosome partitioning protein
MTAPALAVVPRETDEDAGGVLLQIPVDQIDVGDNVRANVEGIDELAASIKEHGLKSPIKVRADGGRWLVVYGQRRLLAHRIAGLERITAIVAGEAYTPDQLAIEQLVENLHRADLPPLDRARAMKTVVEAGTSQADLARELGLHPSTIANDLGLLEAPAPIQKSIESGQLTPAHAKALKGLAAKTQVELAKEAIQYGYSAHRTEEEVQRRKRQADAIREREEQQAKEREANAAELEASIAGFEKKKVAKDARIVVDTGYYGSGTAAAGHVAKLIEAAGYTNVSVAKQYGAIKARPAGGVCDCDVWKAAEFERGNYEGGRYVRHVGVSITKGCVNRKHEQAKEAAAEASRREKDALEERVKAHVRQTAAAWPVPGARAIAIDRILAEAALFSTLSYRLPEWSVAHGGKAQVPWATIHGLSDEVLATELAKAIAGDFRDHAGYHVGWPTLAEELGLVGTPEQDPESAEAPA